MNKKIKNTNTLSRRKMIPILGSSLLIPLFGYSASTDSEVEMGDEEYQTLLKPDGTAVKVKISTVNSSKVVKKNLSNRSFLSWLGKKE